MVTLAERSHVNVKYHWLKDLMSTSDIIGCYWMQLKPDDYQQWKLGFENREHKTNGYSTHISLGLRERLFYFRTVYMYTSVRIYLLYCAYVISYM